MAERVKSAVECDDGDDVFIEPGYMQSLTVFESDGEYSGLLDAEGNPLYKPKGRIGFL